MVYHSSSKSYWAFLLGSLLTLFLSSTIADNCPKPPITECPTLYLEQCKTEAFLVKNSEICLKIARGVAQDAAVCADFDPNDCKSTDETAATITSTCVLPSITECPSFYKEKCEKDETFATQYATSCVQVLVGTAQDAPSCTDYESENCPRVPCEDLKNPLAQHYCRKGQHKCSVRQAELIAGFERVLKKLNEALEPYSDLIALDPKKIATTDALCQYADDQLGEFERLATVEKDNLAEYTSELGLLRACSATVSEFMKQGRPQNISEALWQSIITNLSEQVKRVNEKEGEIKSRIEKLEDAPQRIIDLKIVHEIAC